MKLAQTLLFGGELELERFGQIVPGSRQIEIGLAPVLAARRGIYRKAGTLTILRDPLLQG
jgi:hypothetical protein